MTGITALEALTSSVFERLCVVIDVRQMTTAKTMARAVMLMMDPMMASGYKIQRIPTRKFTIGAM